MAEKDNGPVVISGPNAVVSINQSGGVTAGTYINQAPKPELQMINSNRIQNPDGTYTTIATVEVVSPYPAAYLDIEARAEGILGLQVMSQRPGIMILGHTGERSGYHFTGVQNPTGRYTVSVRTAGPVHVDINYNLQ